MKQQTEANKTKKRKRVAIAAVCALVLASVAALLALCGGNGTMKRFFSKNREKLVGTDVLSADVTDFYYTYDASTYPPKYLRYRFFVEDGTYRFYHETREGDHWPLTEADIAVSGSRVLTEAEWAAFFACLDGGTVSPRGEAVESGGAGPWLYLYWNGDGGKIQAFSFASVQAQAEFEALCADLAG